ncbi:WD40-repeat-containing domain protein [Paraphoma chrysanthemicola]|uniref:WD40-repeat-containing domain protein n=1 Tax=Paraphoma chrysanthemicola TaxID=798071 RepID=A0A8K0RGN8_9PLEO|nr:WD40-repeat-containing domain protein [Paraphoma chrysanthemicola]
MNGSGLQVQCLASTRFHERGRDEQELDEDNARYEECDSEDDTQNHEENDVVRSSKGEDDAKSTLEQEHVNTSRDPTPRISSPSPSQSSSSSTSESEDSADSSSDSIATALSSTPHISCIQESQLSPDGSCILTSDYSRSLTVYPISSTVFQPPHPKPLAPYAKLSSPDPIWSFATNPQFNLSDPSSTHVLLSRRDRYITLHNAVWSSDNTIDPNHTTHSPSPLDISTPLASYKLISPLTEALTAPSSLTYTHDSTHFFAGIRNTIALFDIAHQSNPIQRIPTIPSARNVLKGGGVGYKGVITALSISLPSSTYHHTGILAAGTRTRWIGLYDPTSSENISSFTLPRDGDRGARGNGVSSLKWSPDGRYLYIAERRSDVLLIYDVRSFTTCLAFCTGRKADTNQKLGFDVWCAGAVGGFADGASVGGAGHEKTVSHEIWAGGTDGCVRVWRDPWTKEGGVQADEVVRVGDGNMPVVGTMVHASGGLAGVACGWVGVEEDEIDGDEEKVSRSGMQRMGGVMPRIKEGGSVDILGLR